MFIPRTQSRTQLKQSQTSGNESEPKEFLGEEYPNSDEIQIAMVIVFLVIWSIDSFWLKITTINLIPIIVRVPLSILILSMCVYLINAAHKLVIDPENPTFVDFGVFSKVRHPMYLGSVMIFFALSLSTLSIISFGLWGIYFVIYDRFAAYEEQELVKTLGDAYLEYVNKVRRWTPIST